MSASGFREAYEQILTRLIPLTKKSCQHKQTKVNNSTVDSIEGIKLTRAIRPQAKEAFVRPKRQNQKQQPKEAQL